MARLQLDFPEDQYYYTTLLTVRVTDINAANHLGNDSMISMISEARARFLFEFGVPETERDGTGSGRIYTLTVQCSDHSGNSLQGTTTVTVAHDKGH